MPMVLIDNIRRAGWPRSVSFAAVVAVVAVLALTGCWDRPLDTGAPPLRGPAKFVPSYDDTIGAYGDLPGGRQLSLRGYGLVLLPQPGGSRECPPGIRRIIVSQLNRMHVGEGSSVLGGLTIDQLIDSSFTAVVEVRGLMPASGLKGETFDLLVSTLPGTQTTSLEGGTLISTELSVWQRSRAGGIVRSKPYAMASGPVFINPFADPSPAGPDTASRPRASQPADPDAPSPPVGTPADPRRGWILGGGEILKDQPLELILRTPDYYRTNLACEQLNTYFTSTHHRGVANAPEPGRVQLRVPDDYRHQVTFWLALVGQIYLRREPGFLSQRMAQLADEFTWPAHGDRERIRVGLTFIAIGKPGIALLQPLYSHDNPSVAFHAAYAGLRIGDGLALRMLLRLVKDKGAPYRVEAIRALGQPHRFTGIANSLAPLLEEDNPEVRIAAYQAISSLGSSSILTRTVGIDQQLGFRLDVVQCGGPYLIYVTRTVEPRVVLFGGDSMRVACPLFLHSERTGVTLTARAGDDKLTIMRTDPRTGRLIVVRVDHKPVVDRQSGQVVTDQTTGEPVTAPEPVTAARTSFRLDDVIRRLGGPLNPDPEGELAGFGLNYGQTVHILHQLSQMGAVPSRVHLQRLSQPSVELASESPLPIAPDETITDEPAEGPRTIDQPGPATQPEKPAPIIELPKDNEPPRIGY